MNVDGICFSETIMESKVITFRNSSQSLSLPYTKVPAENLVATQGSVGLPAVPPRGERRGEGLDSGYLASSPRG